MFRVLPAALAAVLAAGLLFTAPPVNAESTADTGAAAEPGTASTFTPRSPVRVLDTRKGIGGVTGPVAARGTITLDLSAHVPTSATAVVLNVTGVEPTVGTYVTVFPSGQPRPVASSLNLPARDVRANQVTVTLGPDRQVRLYNNAGVIHLLADLAGHYGTETGTETGARFTALPAHRLLDTRQDGGTPGPGGTRVLDLTGAVPESATAVTFNLTATRATSGTYVTAWPTGTARPTASNLNLPAGDTRPNLVTVALGADQRVSMYNYAGRTDLLVDLTGFYTPEYGAHYLPLSPRRVLDTRNGTGTDGSTEPVGPNGYRGIDLADEVPTTATGVLLNLTGVDATLPTYVVAWAPVGEVPNSSTLNVVPGVPTANAAVVAFASTRDVGLSNYIGNVHLVADLAGVFVVHEPAPCTTDCVRAWGSNSSRELGSGEITDSSSTPVPVVTLSGVRAVSGASYNGYALLADGTVRAWGANYLGQLGNGWQAWGPTVSAVPVPVTGLTGVTSIAARGGTAYALRDDGTVWAWGDNYRRQLGNGTTARFSTVPVAVSGLTDVVAIGAGDATGYAVRADGTLWSWGSNFGGHLGNGSTVEHSATPVQVSGLTQVTAVAGGGSSNGTYALLADGTVWSWGYNFAGSLGSGWSCEHGETCLSRVPVQVSGLTDVTAVASGYSNGLALRADGTVWSWGVNDHGELGNGHDCDTDEGATWCGSAVPVQVAHLDDVTGVAAFGAGGYALRADGTVWSWGADHSGSLGNDSVGDLTRVPVPVQNLTGVSGIGSGSRPGYAITSMS